VINSFLERIHSIDKDFRFMALNDLVQFMKTAKDVVLFASVDEALEKRVILKILKTLEDLNSEVQNMALKR
jgi:hypothetical protein